MSTSSSSSSPRPGLPLAPTSGRNLADLELHGAPPPVPSETELAEAWFDAPPASTRRSSSVPPPPVSAVGEFLGDPLADAWLR